MERLAARIESVAREMVSAYRAEIPEYGTIEDLGVLRDIQEAARDHALLLLRCLAEGRELRKEELAQIAGLGRRRAEQGVRLYSLVRAYQIGTRIVLDHLVAELRALSARGASPDPHEVTQRALRLSAHAGEAVCRAYEERAQATGVQLERARQGSVAQLLEGEAQIPQAARDMARSLGLTLGETHVVAVFGVATDPRGPAGDSPWIARVADSLMASLDDGLCPVPLGLHGAFYVALVAGTEDDSPRCLADALRAALCDPAAAASAGRIVVGVGGNEPGAPGIRTSYRQALTVAELLCRTPDLGPVLVYDDARVALRLLLEADPLLAGEVASMSIGRLLDHDRQARTDLVATLDAYLDAGRQVRLAARRLHLDHKVVYERLALIKRLTGRSLADRYDLTLLELGFLAARRARKVPDRSRRSVPTC